MLFNSLEFAIFFPIVTLLYFLFRDRARVWLLLLASCFFYMAYRNGALWYYLGFLFTLIGLDYVAGFLIEQATGFQRKLALGLSLAANIGLLGFFKYFNFLNTNLASAFHSAGLGYSIPNHGWELPIGLSFHTFQAMSYTMEVYYGRQKAERSLPVYALYVLFYPQLVAGPIERPQNLIHQFREAHRFDYARLVQGVQLMLTGLLKKMAIADRLAPLVDTVYKAPTHYSGAQLLVATYFFAVQIYCDFSGYTDIARGAATVMGFRIMENFERPYLAPSIAEFWRRWHISLSTWFRDYVYIPLGGNRLTEQRTYFNLAAVFLLSGFWHGANWTYLVWGALHGTLFIVYLSTRALRARVHSVLGLDRHSGWHRFLAVLVSSNLVVFTWIFFRAGSLGDAMEIVRRIFCQFAFPGWRSLHAGLDLSQFVIGLVLIVCLFLVEGVGGKKALWQWIDSRRSGWRWGAYYLFAVGLIVLILTNPVHKAQQFIYFQF